MAQYELNIHDYWRILKKRRWILFLTTIAVLGSVVVFTNLQIPIYQAAATVKVEPSIAIPGVATDQSGWDIYSALNTEVKIIKSTLVSERTARKLGLIDENTPEQERQAISMAIQGKVAAERIGDSNLINISATSSNPRETAQLANMTAEVYIEKGIEDRSRRARELREFIEKQLNDAKSKLKKSEDKLRIYTEKSGASGVGGYLTTRLMNIENKKAELLEKYTEQHPEILSLDQQIEILKKQMKELPTEELEYSRLTRELKINEQLYTLLAKRFKEAQISEADRVQSAFVVTPAVEPKAPIKPNRMVNLSVGAFLGVFLGFVFALIIENLDTSIGTIEDVEKFLDLPVVGIIPHIEIEGKIKNLMSLAKNKEQKAWLLRSKLIPFHSSKSPFVEAYHTLRTNLKLTLLKESGKIVALTSAGISEGKTITASNFALASAQSGIKTLLIETDLRRPSLHSIFGLTRGPGFTDCIIGTKNWNEVIRGTTDFLLSDMGTEKILKTPGIENLSLITSGPLVPNPLDLLNSPRVREILDEIISHYELVILDCPPVLLFADTLVISTLTDGTIIVYQVGRMARRALKRAKDQLTNVKAPVLGVVLNNVKTSEMGQYYGYGYYYSYKYYSKGDQPTQNKAKKQL
ncbi:MAG: polysaccharide biosynthesis tyrosine autokinase [Endomicrobiales bacterium]|nr:polysaccharide biosynthesis tyrosine autokinase [Endomicrobiales bacterium]